MNLTKFHCSSSFENNGSQTFVSKSGSIHFGSFRNDSYIKGCAQTTQQRLCMESHPQKVPVQYCMLSARATAPCKNKQICNVQLLPDFALQIALCNSRAKPRRNLQAIPQVPLRKHPLSLLIIVYTCGRPRRLELMIKNHSSHQPLPKDWRILGSVKRLPEAPYHIA